MGVAEAGMGHGWARPETGHGWAGSVMKQGLGWDINWGRGWDRAMGMRAGK